jgi:hypothetical protein
VSHPSRREYPRRPSLDSGVVLLRFVLDALRPARWLNDRMQEVGVPVVGVLVFLAIAGLWGWRWATIALVSLICVLFPIEGVRLRFTLDGGGRLGRVVPARSEWALESKYAIVGDLIRLCFTNTGRRAKFTAVATWLRENEEDFGYSPWQVQWAPEGNTEIELSTGDRGYLVPLILKDGPDDSSIVYARIKGESLEPEKFKNVQEGKPRIRISITRLSPDATSDAIIGFEESRPPELVVLRELVPRKNVD